MNVHFIWESAPFYELINWQWSLNYETLKYVAQLYLRHITVPYRVPTSTRCGLMTTYGEEIWVKTGSGKGFLPVGPNPYLNQFSLITSTSIDIWGQFHKRSLSHKSLRLVYFNHSFSLWPWYVLLFTPFQCVFAQLISQPKPSRPPYAPLLGLTD